MDCKIYIEESNIIAISGDEKQVEYKLLLLEVEVKESAWPVLKKNCEK